MERSLIWSAIALGGVGWLCCLLVHLGSDRKLSISTLWQKLHTSAIWIAAGLPLVIFGVTMPSQPPFSAGHGLGIGFLIGGLAALIGSIPTLLMKRSEVSMKNAAAITGGMWLTLSAVGIGIFRNPDFRTDILVSLAIGHCAVSTVLFSQLLHDDESRLAAPALLLNTLFAAVLCGITVLGIDRGGDVLSSLRWSSSAMLMAVAIPVAITIASIPFTTFLRPFARIPGAGSVASTAAKTVRAPSARTFGGQLFSGLIGFGVATELVKISSTRIMEPRCWTTLVGGIGAALVVWLLVAEEDRRPSDEVSSLSYSGLGALVLVGVGVAAFSWMRGFGQGILALGMLSVAGIAAVHDLSLPSETRAHIESRMSRFAALLALPVAWVVFRVIQTRFSDSIRSVGLSDHFALIGFVLGMTLPALAAAIASPRKESTSGFHRAARLACAAVIIVGVPAIAMLLWKSKIVLAMISGFALSSTGLAIRGNRSVAALHANLLTCFWSIAGLLALAQFSNRWISASTLTREGKIHVIEGIVGGVILLLFLVEVGARYKTLSETMEVEVAS
ncbi:MAG: hypothetical protein ABJA67_09530 [Chthonomonadales bacterium]